jgi:hypothetical protein
VELAKSWSLNPAINLIAVLQTQLPKQSGLLDQELNIEYVGHGQATNELSSLHSRDSHNVVVLSQREGKEVDQRGNDKESAWLEIFYEIFYSSHYRAKGSTEPAATIEAV